jgi:hypothetical protein
LEFRLGSIPLSSKRFGLFTMKQTVSVSLLTALFAGAFSPSPSHAASEGAARGEDLWTLCRSQVSSQQFSTLFTAQDVRRYLANEEGLQSAIDWCKKTGVTKVYVETFRDAYRAERGALQHAKEKLTGAGLEVSGCVTPTRVGKPSTRWKEVISCYTDKPTQDKLKEIFEFTAGLFDEIMIDDFWFTDCACPECDAARKAKQVIIGDRTSSASADTWEAYRCELMTRLSREYVLGPAKRVNPKARLIIKYPQWYDTFHERGYEVIQETADFDRIWVGTETRDYQDQRWGGTPQYEAYFIMRWLGGIGGSKCGGGWFDPLGTTPATYLEQARQTVLGGARESMLFCYGALQRDTGPGNVECLRTNIAELLSVGKEVRSRSLVGIAAYKPANSHPEKEPRVFDFVGMLGVPLVPCHEFPTNAPAAFFSVHALKDPGLATKLNAYISAGKPVLLTDSLSQALTNQVKLHAPNVRVLPVKQEPKSLLQLDEKSVNELRTPLLRAVNCLFRAPNRVGLYLFTDGSWVVENFNDLPAQVKLNGVAMTVGPRSWRYAWK